MSGGRVLMIAHHFPPMAGSGSNRALAFARYLPEYGWQPVVVTPGEAWASPRDDRLGSEVPPSLRVVRTGSFERRPQRASVSQANATATASRPNPLRAQLGHLKRFPDAHLGWLPFAVAAARRQHYDVAYSSSGPFTSHLIGLILKRTTGRRWVAELRDGWYRWNRAIFADYPRWRNGLERRLERAALRGADSVVLVTDRMADAFRRQYADLPHEHFAVVPNGFDARQFGEALELRVQSSSFEVLHTGALYYGRSLAAFLDAAERLVGCNADFARSFKLILLGTLDTAARAELGRHELGDRIQVRGQVDHASALAAMRSADVLLLVANTTPGAEATVPGKLFEYLAAGRPVLCIAPQESSTSDVLDHTGGGWLAPANDPVAIACVLERAFATQQTGGVQVPDQKKVRRFDRRLLAGDLARIFDEVSTGVARRV
jgi:glycosyltransferase involved in cell wall biosynthesis